MKSFLVSLSLDSASQRLTDLLRQVITLKWIRNWTSSYTLLLRMKSQSMQQGQEWERHYFKQRQSRIMVQPIAYVLEMTNAQTTLV